MSEPTKDAPFEFEGVKVWIEPDGWNYRDTSVGAEGELTDAEFRAIAACAAAHPGDEPLADWERELLSPVEDSGWRWTNAERTAAQKDRWTATLAITEGWVVRHDDFPGAYWASLANTSGNHPRWRIAGYAALDSFLAWLDAHAPAPEPAWKSWKPGDVGQVRIDGGEWETVYVCTGVLVRSMGHSLYPWDNDFHAEMLSDSRNVTITPDAF